MEGERERGREGERERGREVSGGVRGQRWRRPALSPLDGLDERGRGGVLEFLEEGFEGGAALGGRG